MIFFWFSNYISFSVIISAILFAICYRYLTSFVLPCNVFPDFPFECLISYSYAIFKLLSVASKCIISVFNLFTSASLSKLIKKFIKNNINTFTYFTIYLSIHFFPFHLNALPIMQAILLIFIITNLNEFPFLMLNSHISYVHLLIHSTFIL